MVIIIVLDQGCMNKTQMGEEKSNQKQVLRIKNGRVRYNDIDKCWVLALYIIILNNDISLVQSTKREQYY